MSSFLDGRENEIRSSFKIESSLDPSWAYLSLRQSQVWLFIDVKETRRLWADALDRVNKLNDGYSHFIWDKIIEQARQHPFQIRDTYKIAMSYNDPHYIKQWMNYAGNKYLNIEMPKILNNNALRRDVKNNILSHWKLLSPNSYEDYMESNLSN